MKVSKVPAAHAAEALLGVYPGRQVAVQAAPAAIEVTPSPQDPVVAPLATAGTAHAPVELWQVGVTKVPIVHAAWAMSGVNPVAQATAQVEPCAIEAPLLQRAVAALVTVGSVEGVTVEVHGLGSQVKAAKVPAVHKALRSPFASAAMLGVYPVAQARVQDAALATEGTPAPQVSEAALAT